MEHQVSAAVEQALADLQQAVGADIDRQTGDAQPGRQLPSPNGAPNTHDKEPAR
jgi:hypothetical protein